MPIVSKKVSTGLPLRTWMSWNASSDIRTRSGGFGAAPVWPAAPAAATRHVIAMAVEPRNIRGAPNDIGFSLFDEAMVLRRAAHCTRNTGLFCAVRGTLDR